MYDDVHSVVSPLVSKSPTNIYSETWELGTPKGLSKNCPEF